MRNATPLKVTIKSAPTATGSAAPAGEAGSVDAVAPLRAGTSTNATKDGSVLQMTVDYAFAFDRYEVAPPYTEFPKSTHGKVFFTDPSTGTNYVCSGTALSSENRSVVWTAAHCVNGGGGPWYTNWLFAPARRDGSNPYGTFAARELWSTSGWASGGDISYDLGAAVVNVSGGSLLVNAVGVAVLVGMPRATRTTRRTHIRPRRRSVASGKSCANPRGEATTFLEPGLQPCASIAT
jgi:hypothetical protein